MLVQAQNQKERNKHIEKDENSAQKEINIDPKTYCKLGHFHLLLEDYAKGNGILKVARARYLKQIL